MGTTVVKKTGKPELLAPAGNLECAVAAFESGADAVYAGLSRFNAREKSDNFSFSDMSKLSAFAKKHKKKVYLTLNTLIKERELEEVFNDLSRILPLNVDAVIVQDIGIVRLIREFFPALAIHASTQMGIHNSAGIRTAQRMGISRVILERQVTLDELEILAASSPLEVEVFIHGALCCSLSGNCLFSSWIGGWSGNRGKCKQPCRRRYHSKTGENGFFFSTNDLYTLDLLPRLIKIGVSSLKIEGRLKKADYVSRSVRAYRMVLDSEPGRERETLGKAKTILAGSPGRKWSSGFYTEESLKTVVQYTSSGVSGSLSGEVVSVGKDGFTVAVSRDLKIGDRIRLQPRTADEGPQFFITAMERNGRGINRAQKGETVVLPGKRAIPDRALVYKVGETPRTTATDLNTLEEMQPVRFFNLSITLSRSRMVVSCVNFSGTPSWEKDLDLGKAENRKITEDTLGQMFRATRNEKLKLGKIRVSITGDPFLPVSLLKKLRREFWLWVEEHTETLFAPENAAGGIDTFIQTHFSTHSLPKDSKRGSSPDICMLPQSGKTSHCKGEHTAVSMSVFAYDKTCTELFLPVFTSEEKIPSLQGAIEKSYQSGIRAFRIRSLYQLELLRKYSDISITAAYPLPVSNSFSARELKDFGITSIQAWVELEKQALYDLIDYSPLPVEIYRKGRPHILATRAYIQAEGSITDSHGGKFTVKKDSTEELTFLYGRQALEIPPVEGTRSCFDYTNTDPSEEDTTTFNFLREWM